MLREPPVWSGAEQGSLTNTGYHHAISEHQEAVKSVISGATHKFEIWWPCENTPHTNPVTHNFFMSTGMLCEQNNVFLTLTFQGDNLQLWPVFLTLLSEWGWAAGLSYWRSGDLGCSFCGFHLFQLWVCCIQGLIPGQICVCSSLWILFLECFRRFQLMFHCLASVPLSFLSLLPLVLLFPRALNADFYAVGLCYAFNTWSYFL